jgi:hypothetical protein
VRREHLEAALALWDYCHASAAYIFGQATGDRTADAIAAALREAASSGLTKTQISDLFSRKKSATEINRPLESLQARGLVRAAVETTDGRSITRFFYTQGAKKAKEAKKAPSPADGNGLNSLNSLNSPPVINEIYFPAGCDVDEILEREALRAEGVGAKPKSHAS